MFGIIAKKKLYIFFELFVLAIVFSFNVVFRCLKPEPISQFSKTGFDFGCQTISQYFVKISKNIFKTNFGIFPTFFHSCRDCKFQEE